jgi:hypothetical protein
LLGPSRSAAQLSASARSSPGATRAAAIDNAAELLRPYQGDERVKALIEKLTTISDEGASEGDSAERLAKSIADCERLAVAVGQTLAFVRI